jgi:hypothetical protein
MMGDRVILETGSPPGLGKGIYCRFFSGYWLSLILLHFWPRIPSLFISDIYRYNYQVLSSEEVRIERINIGLNVVP